MNALFVLIRSQQTHFCKEVQNIHRGTPSLCPYVVIRTPDSLQNRVGLEIFQIWSYYTSLEADFDADFKKPHD